jgi:hypothetical protein
LEVFEWIAAEEMTLAEETLLRHGTVVRVLKSDEDLELNLSKKAVETLNRATCHLVRTLAKACAVTAARSGKKRVEREVLEEVINKYIRLHFLIDCLPVKQGITLEQQD